MLPSCAGQLQLGCAHFFASSAICCLRLLDSPAPTALPEQDQISAFPDLILLRATAGRVPRAWGGRRAHPLERRQAAGDLRDDGVPGRRGGQGESEGRVDL